MPANIITSTPVIVREEALARNAARYGDPVFRKEGTKLIIYSAHPLFDANGDDLGTAHLQVIGRRTFGKLVHFDLDSCVTMRVEKGGETMLASAEDAEYLRQGAVYMLEELARLCRCGKLPASCDCCPTCLGSGFSRLTPSIVECSPCEGRGYLDSVKAPSEGENEPPEAS